MFKLKAQDKETISKLDLKAPSIWLATWFGSGFINPAPGTWGSLAAIPLGLLIFALGGTAALYAGIIFVCFIGYWAAIQFEKQSGEHDSKMVVIDEVAGQWIALIPAALNPFLILLAFLLFRFFDIIKPWPISFYDKKVKGAEGVMGDDILAGLFAGICIIGVRYAGFG